MADGRLYVKGAVLLLATPGGLGWALIAASGPAAVLLNRLLAAPPCEWLAPPGPARSPIAAAPVAGGCAVVGTSKILVVVVALVQVGGEREPRRPFPQ